jgi:hypothetical protein
MYRRLTVWIGVCFVSVLLIPTSAEAQGSISGLVEDTTGGILPGVRVEAASPVLIEGALSAFTDSAGRYTITNLRPGTYKVTFTLDGFRSLVHEDVLLTGDSAVQVNAQMTVGQVAESITVSGQSPLVDTQQVRGQFVTTREMMDVLPGASTFAGRALLVPGVRNTGMGEGQYWPAAHGNTWRDAQTTNDGMRANVLIDDGQWQMGWEMNQSATAEMSYEAGGAPADVQVGGVVQNAIPKEGGNMFAGTGQLLYGHENLSNDNSTPELRQQVGEVNRLAYTYDINAGYGGPIVRDKFWFFGAFRRRDAKTWAAGSVFTGEGTPEQRARNGFGAAGTQGFNRTWANSGVLRLTNQLTDRHKWRIGFEKISTTAQIQDTDRTRPPESANRVPQPAGFHAQARWTSTLTNRLLLEAGFSTQYNKWRREQFEWNEGSKSSYLNLANGQWGGAFWITGHQPEDSKAIDAKVSYVTGSHNLKAGFQNRWGDFTLYNGPHPGDVRAYYHSNGFPLALAVLATPLGSFAAQINHDIGIYAQDTWTLGRWTLNLGVRGDIFSNGSPPQSAEAGAWVPARSFPAYQGASWATVVPRLGVSYDVFGDGRTAIKAYAHKYVNQESTTLALAVNPMASYTWGARQETRSWFDLDRNNSVVAADGRIQYEEVGPSPNVNFATAADAARMDLDKRPGQWEFNASVQHELFRGYSVGFGYYRRDYYDQWREDNVTQSFDDYSPFSIPGPVDPKLGSYSGQVLPLYNLSPAVYGQSDRLIRTATTERLYDGFEWTARGRFGRSGFFGGSITTEKTYEDNCDVENRNSTLWCDFDRAWQTQFKGHIAYTLPGQIISSAFIQGYPGPDISANYTVTPAIALAQAGVVLTGGQNITVDLLPPEVYFLPFQTKLDLRFMRRFMYGNRRVAPILDIYNLLNANTTTGINQTCCSARYQEITSIMQARYFRVGLEFDW